MPVEWSGSGPQFLIQLDRDARIPLRVQVEGQLRAAIQAGRLAAGERVPSSRALATYLGLSRGVIQDCYAQLQAEGYLSSRGGSATRVAATASGPRPEAPPPPAPAYGPGLIASFESGVPDLGLVPRDDWAWAVREACRAAPNTAQSVRGTRPRSGTPDSKLAISRGGLGAGAGFAVGPAVGLAAALGRGPVAIAATRVADPPRELR